jgi:hypothetical protein
MTLPDERFRAILQTEEFLRALTDPSLTPRVPKVVRQRAYWCLRHYPSYYNLKEMEYVAPDLLQEKMEDVTRMFAEYGRNKNEN